MECEGAAGGLVGLTEPGVSWWITLWFEGWAPGVATWIGAPGGSW